MLVTFSVLVVIRSNSAVRNSDSVQVAGVKRKNLKTTGILVMCLKAVTFMKMFRPLKQIRTDEFKKMPFNCNI